MTTEEVWWYILPSRNFHGTSNHTIQTLTSSEKNYLSRVILPMLQ
ncbi:hypothetical protein QTG54_001572 [Skeletonema marinoi]|uniref:Uncharacterized protein n=1 Tax=Skeletonema marinoi TaxID=267567 RepID=A0AAD8YJ95_9STRA|nr:hypothetical protein QTG54_001572 [Skeletonema marinoi]